MLYHIASHYHCSFTLNYMMTLLKECHLNTSRALNVLHGLLSDSDRCEIRENIRMKKEISSDNEIMFRDEEDYNRGFNCFALALHKTDSILICLFRHQIRTNLWVPSGCHIRNTSIGNIAEAGNWANQCILLWKLMACIITSLQ